jgi:hypothetical protein
MVTSVSGHNIISHSTCNLGATDNRNERSTLSVRLLLQRSKIVHMFFTASKKCMQDWSWKNSQLHALSILRPFPLYRRLRESPSRAAHGGKETSSWTCRELNPGRLAQRGYFTYWANPPSLLLWFLLLSFLWTARSITHRRWYYCSIGGVKLQVKLSHNTPMDAQGGRGGIVPTLCKRRLFLWTALNNWFL